MGVKYIKKNDKIVAEQWYEDIFKKQDAGILVISGIVLIALLATGIVYSRMLKK